MTRWPLCKSQALVSLIASLIASLLFAACNGSEPNNPPGQPADKSPAQPASTAATISPAAPVAGATSNLDYASAAGYEGFHDITNCNGILGWVRNLKQPNTPVKVDLYDGDTLMATVTADQPRADLLAAGKGSGKFGFVYSVPERLKDGKPHTIRMTISGTQLHLTHTPKVLTCTP